MLELPLDICEEIKWRLAVRKTELVAASEERLMKAAMDDKGRFNHMAVFAVLNNMAPQEWKSKQEVEIKDDRGFQPLTDAEEKKVVQEAGPTAPSFLRVVENQGVEDDSSD